MKYMRSFLAFSCMMTIVLALSGPGIACGNDGLTVAGFDSGEMQEGIPSGWKLVANDGTPNLTLERKDTRYVLHMKSDRHSSFGNKKRDRPEDRRISLSELGMEGCPFA